VSSLVILPRLSLARSSSPPPLQLQRGPGAAAIYGLVEGAAATETSVKVSVLDDVTGRSYTVQGKIEPHTSAGGTSDPRCSARCLAAGHCCTGAISACQMPSWYVPPPTPKSTTAASDSCLAPLSSRANCLNPPPLHRRSLSLSLSHNRTRSAMGCMMAGRTPTVAKCMGECQQANHQCEYTIVSPAGPHHLPQDMYQNQSIQVRLLTLTLTLFGTNPNPDLNPNPNSPLAARHEPRTNGCINAWCQNDAPSVPSLTTNPNS
jgi:hypothetical protein